MSEALRIIVWVTGVAFGVFAPGGFARNATDAGATKKIRALQPPIVENRGVNQALITAMNRERE